ARSLPPLYPWAVALGSDAAFQPRQSAAADCGPDAETRLCRSGRSLPFALPGGRGWRLRSPTCALDRGGSGASGRLQPVHSGWKGRPAMSAAILEAIGIDKTYAMRRDGKAAQHFALRSVSASLEEGEILGIVGESG